MYEKEGNMKPSSKDPGMESFLDLATTKLFGRARTTSIRSGYCVTCGKQVGTFKDSLSAKEYTISGMCQECQDSVFGKEGNK